MNHDTEETNVRYALTFDEIEEFRTLIREETGLELSHEEAFNRATELIGLVRVLISPLPEDPEVDV